MKRKKRPAVEAKIRKQSLEIRIGGYPHLYLRRVSVAGFQSWREKGEPLPYVIEITATDGHRITLEYDREWKWKAVLARIGEAFQVWP